MCAICPAVRRPSIKNVLFISNHQTYFADVVAMFHVFNASLSGRIDSIKNVGYLWSPKLKDVHSNINLNDDNGQVKPLFEL